MGLGYNNAYHMHCELALRSGRVVTLQALDQEVSYAGLLEGVPDARSNDWYVERSLRAAGRLCAAGAAPHLIAPARRDYLREPGDMRGYVEERPRRIPEWLPPVRCIGLWQGGVTARHPERHVSVLVVVWFQDEYGPPLAGPARDALLALDWEALASDVDL